MISNDFAFIEYVPLPQYTEYAKSLAYNNWMSADAIAYYRLVNRRGEFVDIKPEECKKAFDSGEITIVNINKINSTRTIQRKAKGNNGVFEISHGIPTTIDPNIEKSVLRFVQNAKQNGLEAVKKSVRTGCGHRCVVYLFTRNDITDALVVIPDDVFFLNLSERPLVFSNKLKTFGINGTVKFVGGKNLRHFIEVFYNLWDCGFDLTDVTVTPINIRGIKAEIEKVQLLAEGTSRKFRLVLGARNSELLR